MAGITRRHLQSQELKNWCVGDVAQAIVSYGITCK
jgi:hypothetical protein